MNGIEKITQQIAMDTQIEVDAIMAKAQEDVAAVQAQYKAQGKAERERILQQGEIEVAQSEARLTSMTQLEVRKLLLGAKQEIVDKAFDKALEHMVNLPEEDYIALLAKLAVEAVHTGTEQVIFSQKDRTRVGKAVVTRANQMMKKGIPATLTLAEDTYPMAGGLILRDNKVETNCSFEVLIHLKRDMLAAEVAKVLF